MADKPEKILKTFDKGILIKQVSTVEDIIKQYQQQILKLQAQIQQQLGVAAFAKHLLEQYELPDSKTNETIKS